MLLSVENKRLKKGFTIIELMIVILVIGMLMAALYYGLGAFRSRGAKAAAKQQLRSLRQSIENFAEDTGEYPNTLDDLLKKPSDEKIAESWEGPYIDKRPKAPARMKLNYQKTEGGEREYELYIIDPADKARIDVWKS